MTQNQPDDGIERVEGRFDAVAESRYWLPAASEQHCKRISRRRGIRLVKVVNTKIEPLPIICIFEGYPDD
ncbi:hypothetical protein WA1_42465 [Scytonema hofmannii PCC 7110]|uniref:Uncharacterized protein n=1 Tax=Scytonema hofmannii PCC 7110 TaxID=128403 RepID=A0A139WVC0_9CYAN|nr:hypothetical protein [Scytonema hofmannii]KYC36377.1 hypothetical protein WA1_42465 [Scytonema hofmannii PCC 7110]